MSKKFRTLFVPEGYRHYWSKYPEGYTILEALLNWVDSVNQLTENVNDWNIYLDDFVENFDENLRSTVRDMLNEMETDGSLAEIINEEIFSDKADKTYVDVEFSQINTQLSETSTQLADRPTKAEVDSDLNTKRDKAVPIGLNDTDSELLNAIQNSEGTPFELLSIPRDNSVDVLKTDFVERSKNIFNKKTANIGYVVNTVHGELTPSGGGNSSSDFIRVTPSTDYIKNFTETPNVVFYDKNKNYISSELEAVTFTTPENCYYVRFNIHSSLDLESVQLEEGTVVTEYENYYIRLKDARYNIKTQDIEDEAVTVEKVDFVERSKNLFNKDTANIGYVVNTVHGDLVPSSANNSSSDFIRVKPNTDYVKNFTETPQVIFYDKNKNYISSVLEDVTFTTPENCYYIRFNIYYSLSLENIQLEEGTQSTSFEHFGYRFKHQSIPTVEDNAVGVRFSLSSKTSSAERIDGLTDVEGKYPFNEIRLCNVNKTDWGSTVVTYENETGFSRNGSNGEVMVEIPKHYFKRYIENGYEYVLLSGTQLDGFELDPVFIENGKELNAVYVGAYDGAVRDSKLRSISGVNPTTTYNLTEFRQFSHNQGTGFGVLDYRTVAMLQRLFVVYFADRNSQKMVGSGMVDFAFQNHESTKAINSGLGNVIIVDESTNKRFFQLGQAVSVNTETNQIENRLITNMSTNGEGHTEITFDGDPVNIVTGETMVYSHGQDTGHTDNMTQHTGMANFFGGKDGYDAVKFLHIENLWGNVWNELDGVALHYLVPYVGENMQDYTSDVNEMKSKYKPLAYKVPLQETNDQGGGAGEWATYIKNLMYDKINPAYQLPFVLGNGADSDSHYADPYYSHDDEYEIPSYGGGFDHMIRAGIFTMRFWYTPTGSNVLLNGARLIYKPI